MPASAAGRGQGATWRAPGSTAAAAWCPTRRSRWTGPSLAGKGVLSCVVGAGLGIVCTAGEAGTLGGGGGRGVCFKQCAALPPCSAKVSAIVPGRIEVAIVLHRSDEMMWALATERAIADVRAKIDEVGLPFVGCAACLFYQWCILLSALVAQCSALSWPLLSLQCFWSVVPFYAITPPPRVPDTVCVQCQNLPELRDLTTQLSRLLQEQHAGRASFAERGACTQPNCPGYLIVTGAGRKSCIACNTQHCTRCRELLAGPEHACDPSLLDNLEALKESTRCVM